MKYKNNPFNIRSGSRWLGLSGSKNGFCEFEDIDYGIRAAAVLLMQSYRKKGCFTLSSVISRFAPSVENNTESYIRFVCSELGFPANKVLVNTYDYASLLSVMSCFETGTKISQLYIFNVIIKFNISVFCLTSKK